MNTSELLDALRRHYIPDAGQSADRAGGAFAHEVSVNGGMGSARRVDALYDVEQLEERGQHRKRSCVGFGSRD